MELSDGQRLALFLAAQRDEVLSTLERAAAGLGVEGIEVRKEPVPGLVVGQGLTDRGRETVRGILPDLSPAVFPFVVKDVVRRLVGHGVPWVDVRVDAVAEEDWEFRKGYRVSWDEGDAWRFFSRKSDHYSAALNRAELEACAKALGLVVEAETAPTLLVLAPAGEPIVIKRATLEKMLSPLDEANARLDREFLAMDAALRDQKERRRMERTAFLSEHGVTRADDLDEAAYADYIAKIIVD